MNTYGRKKKNTRSIIIMLVISWVVIIGGIVWFIFEADSATDSNNQPENQDSQEDNRWFVGENILLNGTLSESTTMSDYTHRFVSSEGDVFGAKSSSVDLFGQEGNVELRGEIDDVQGGVPIIAVSEMAIDRSGSDQGEDGIDENNEITLQGNESLYYSFDKGLMIDMSISGGYEVVESEGDIRIIDTDNGDAEVLLVDDFACEAGNSLQDCQALRERFIEFNNTSFTNALGVTFYNLTETDNWYAFNGNEIGYSIRATGENQISTFGSLIGFVSEGILTEFVEENISQCSSLNSSLETIETIDFNDQDNGLIEVMIDGVSNRGGDASCRGVIKLGSPFRMEVAQYTVVPGTETEEVDNDSDELDDNNEDSNDDPSAQDTQNEAQEDSENETEDTNQDDQGAQDNTNAQLPDPIQPPSTNAQRPDSFDGWLQYSSVRGFVMWFSQQGVSYFGSILDEPVTLGQDGVSCPYKVNVIQWQNAYNVEENPDIIIYECIGVDPDALPENTQLVGQVGDEYFLARWYTPNLSSMEIYVEPIEEENQETETDGE